MMWPQSTAYGLHCQDRSLETSATEYHQTVVILLNFGALWYNQHLFYIHWKDH